MHLKDNWAESHISSANWAASHGVIDEVYTLMVSLSENQWYHYGE